MQTTLNTYTVADVCHGFTYNELEGKGLFGLSGKLTIQPEYQRNVSPRPYPIEVVSRYVVANHQ